VNDIGRLTHLSTTRYIRSVRKSLKILHLENGRRNKGGKKNQTVSRHRTTIFKVTELACCKERLGPRRERGRGRGERHTAAAHDRC